MFYIVETSEQLDRLEQYDECFIRIVTGNDSYHPLQTYPVLVYYRNKDKGYILPIKHSETFPLRLSDIQAFLNKHTKVYCQDQKYTSYFLQHANLIDLNQTILDQENRYKLFECNTKVHQDFYSDRPYVININELIPVSKHYEKCECLYEQLVKYIGLEDSLEFYTDYATQYQTVEKAGIDLNASKFGRHYDPTWEAYSIENSVIYTSYNLYNLTTRPTNAFNAINFLALNKEDGSRKSFIPRYDLFIEFDFEAYHLILIAKLIGYTFDSTISVHTQLGQQYFSKEELTPEEYAQSKAITFKQIYGGVQKEYKSVEFFQKIEEYITNLWKEYQDTGKIVLQTGRALHKLKNDFTPQKLFNYQIQNLETYQNVKILKRLNELLEDKLSKVVLVVYDSFLLDYSLQDGKQVLLDIKEIIQSEGFTVKAKIGQNYDSLKLTTYL
jgi:hypothetical protein